MTVTIHGAQLSFFEMIAVPGLFVLVFLRAAMSFKTKIRIRMKTAFDLFIALVLLFLVSIGLSWYGALDRDAVVKTALKWLEIFGVAGIVFLYSSTARRFNQAWWLLILVYLVGVLVSYVSVSIRIGEFDYMLARNLPGYSALFLLSLLVPFIRRPLIFFAVLGLGATVVASLTRGAWIGLAAVSTYWIWRSPKKRAAITGMIVAGIILFGAICAAPHLYNIMQYKYSTSVSLTSSSNKERLGMAATCLEAFAEHPFTGIGAGNFSALLLRGGIPAFVDSPNPETLTPHNFFLQVAAEEGIVGLVAIFGMLFVLYKILFSVAKGTTSVCVEGLKFYFIPVIVALFFGYVAGETRFTLGLFMGLVLATLRSGVVEVVQQ